jgi:hypothetical protein
MMTPFPQLSVFAAALFYHARYRPCSSRSKTWNRRAASTPLQQQRQQQQTAAAAAASPAYPRSLQTLTQLLLRSCWHQASWVTLIHAQCKLLQLLLLPLAWQVASQEWARAWVLGVD